MQEKSILKVLQVTIGDGNFGGVASFLYTYYSYIDHSRVHFDFLYCGENSMQTKEGDAVLAGSTVTTLHILKRSNNGIADYWKLLHELKTVLNDGKYDIIHVNSSNLFLNICVAHVLNGRKKLISHSHNTEATIEYSGRVKSLIKRIIRKTCTHYIVKKADALFACSRAAGLFLFGEKGVSSERFRLIRNAIALSKYTFNPTIRENVLNGEDRLIVGYVGRLTDQKNPLFVIDVFKEIHSMNSNSVLWMIGEGELKDKTMRYISDLALNDSVKMLGYRDDVAQLMQAMDVLLLPSLYEGLSIVVIEAQASGLPVFASDSISSEHKLTDLVRFISLKKPAREWAASVLEALSSAEERHQHAEDLVQAGYEITSAAASLESLYLSIYQSSES